MSLTVSPAASARAGSTWTSISRSSPAVTVMGPTPATRDSAGRTSYSATSRSCSGGTLPSTLTVRTGNDVGVSRSACSVVAGGSSLRVSPRRACTSCSAVTMSLSGSNCSEISTAPRIVRERTRVTPRTGASASSSGRVTLRRTSSAVASGRLATTTTRGNASSG